MRNINGQRFDLMRPGRHTLLQVPRGAGAEDILLEVEAEAHRLGSRCADIYFQELNLTGAWAEAKQRGGLHFRARHDGNEEELQWTTFGKVDLKVVQGHTHQGIRYLNLYVKHLGRAGHSVGGLLGEDDHVEAATPDSKCAKRVALQAEPKWGDHHLDDLTAPSASFAEAALA